MTEENNTIRINRDKETPIEFKVKIEGADDLLDKTKVYFIIHLEKFCLSFDCEHGTDDNWKVVIPVLPEELLENGSYDMCVEVIVDNYFFKPATGQVTILSAPEVSFAPKKEAVKPEEKKDVAAEGVSAGAGDSQGQVAPTTNLLKPEKPPKNIHRVDKSAVQKSPEDELIDTDKLFSEIVPGEGEQYAQDDNEDDKFNPQKVAERIVLDALGIKPEARAKLVKQVGGSLFKRGNDGRLIVEGLDDPTFKVKISEAAARQKEEKVKALLRDLAN